MTMLFGTTILWDALWPAPLPAPAALPSARAASGCDGSILRGLDSLFLLMTMV
jgi:hypothetical protein